MGWKKKTGITVGAVFVLAAIVGSTEDETAPTAPAEQNSSQQAAQAQAAQEEAFEQEQAKKAEREARQAEQRAEQRAERRAQRRADRQEAEPDVSDLPDDVLDLVYVTTVRDSSDSLDGATDEQIIEFGKLSCSIFDDGATFYEVGLAALSADTGLSENDIGLMIGSAVSAYCPEHQDEIDAI